jgi:hypothetical protein
VSIPVPPGTFPDSWNDPDLRKLGRILERLADSLDAYLEFLRKERSDPLRIRWTGAGPGYLRFGETPVRYSVIEGAPGPLVRVAHPMTGVVTEHTLSESRSLLEVFAIVEGAIKDPPTWSAWTQGSLTHRDHPDLYVSFDFLRNVWTVDQGKDKHGADLFGKRYYTLADVEDAANGRKIEEAP